MPIPTNPYQSPSGSPAPNVELISSPIPLGVGLPWLFAYSYPILVLFAFYGTWLIAWSALGHAPRPMLDDPKSIDVIMQIAYFIPGILILAMPVLAPWDWWLLSSFCEIETMVGPS